MKARRKPTHPNTGKTPLRERPSWIHQGLWITVFLTALLVPLWVSPAGKETFRVPKEILFRSFGIVLITLALIGVALGKLGSKRIKRIGLPISVAGAILLWAIVTTVTSTVVAVSAESLITTVAAVAFFVAAFVLVRERSGAALLPIAGVAVINAAVYYAQKFGIWQPFRIVRLSDSFTALLGNSNDIGSVLMPIALAALALFFASHRSVRTGAALLFLVSISMLFVSLSATAVLAFVAGFAVMVFFVSWRRTAVAIAMLAIVAGTTFYASAPIHDWVMRGWSNVHSPASLDRAAGGRFFTDVAGLRMVANHPLFGVGPGTFGYHFFDLYPALADEYPALYRNPAPWIDAHDDHVQVLAQEGVPGYLLMLAAIGLVGSVSFRRRTEIALRRESFDRGRFAVLLGLPLALSFSILALAQYPLQLASSTVVLLYLAALTLGWGMNEQAD
ncbi:MAG: O-antigen ligase family protein [Thermoanaerobaculia bacterium]